MIEALHCETPLPKRATPHLPSLLARTRLLRSTFLSREEQHALEAAVSPARTVGPNVDLVREDERADALFFIIHGWSCRYATTRDGGRQLSALLVPGDIGNLDSLMFDRLDYGVRTITETSIVPLPRDRALALAAHHGGIARAFTWLGLVENAILSKWALSLGRRTAIERLAHLLCELSVRLDADGDEESSFAFPLTQEQLADALGLTSVHVNRTLQHLRTDGLIATSNRIMTIPVMAKLRQFCGFESRYLHVGPPGEPRPTQI